MRWHSNNTLMNVTFHTKVKEKAPASNVKCQKSATASSADVTPSKKVPPHPHTRFPSPPHPIPYPLFHLFFSHG
jgi:hypothetical protein